MKSTNKLKLKYLSESNSKKWNNFIEQSKQGCFYQSYEWILTLEKSFGYESLSLMIFEGDNVIAIFPQMLSRTHKLPLNSLHSLPKGFGGPIISSRESECLNIFFREIKKIFTQKNLFHHRIRTNDFYNLRFSKYLSKEGYVPNLNGCHYICMKIFL